MGIPLEIWNPGASGSQYHRWSGARLDSWLSAHNYWLDQVAAVLQDWAMERGLRLPADPEAAMARLERCQPGQLAGLALPVKPVELLHLEQTRSSGVVLSVCAQPAELPPPARTSLELWLQLVWQPASLDLERALAWHSLLRCWEDRWQQWEAELSQKMAGYLYQLRQHGQQGLVPGALYHWPNPRTRGAYLRTTACQQAGNLGLLLPSVPDDLVVWEPMVQFARGELWLAYLPLAMRAVLGRIRGRLEGEAVLDLLIEVVEVLGAVLGRYNPASGKTPAFLEAQVLPTAVERALARQTNPLLSRHQHEALRRLRAARVAASTQGLPATVAHWARLAGLELEEAVQLLAAEQPCLPLEQCVGVSDPVQDDPLEDWGLVAQLLASLPVAQRCLLEEAALSAEPVEPTGALCLAQAAFVRLLREQAPGWVARLEGGL